MKVIIRRNDLFLESTCVFCGEEFPPDIIIATAYNEAGNKSFGEICPQCIHGGAEALQAAIAAQIEQLRDRADRLRQAADDLEAENQAGIELPSWSQWRNTHLKTFLSEINMLNDERVGQFRQLVKTWDHDTLSTYLQEEVQAPEQDDPFLQAKYAIAWHERETRRGGTHKEIE